MRTGACMEARHGTGHPSHKRFLCGYWELSQPRPATCSARADDLTTRSYRGATPRGGCCDDSERRCPSAEVPSVPSGPLIAAMAVRRRTRPAPAPAWSGSGKLVARHLEVLEDHFPGGEVVPAE